MSDGCFNKYYDELPRNYETWSDTNLEAGAESYGVPTPKEGLTTLICNGCNGVTFEVAQTGYYETSARCTGCGKWFIVHAG